MSQTVPAVSLIVPIYKAERYLPHCVESLRHQTLRDIEILLVDDGSPDRCGAMADDYAREDARIRVIHQRNSGVAAARNRGIHEATGEYVGFVDSDDWILPDMCEKLYAAVSGTGAQAAFTGYRIVGHGRIVERHEQARTGDFTSADDIFALRKIYFGHSVNGSYKDEIAGWVWNALFRRAFLLKTGLRFRQVLQEDQIFVIQALQACRHVACIGGTPYCYRRDGQDSRTTQLGGGTIDEIFDYLRTVRRLIGHEPEQYRRECLVRWDRQVIDQSRVLVHRIEAAPIRGAEKSRLIADVYSRPMLAGACSRYPARALPPLVRVFYWCEKYRLVALSRLMMGSWARLSVMLKSGAGLLVRGKRRA